MILVHPVGLVCSAIRQMQAELSWEVVVLDGVFPMRLCVDGHRNVTATFDQYHGIVSSPVADSINDYWLLTPGGKYPRSVFHRLDVRHVERKKRTGYHL